MASQRKWLKDCRDELKLSFSKRCLLQHFLQKCTMYLWDPFVSILLGEENFMGSKVSCLRKQCNDKAWIHIYLNHYISWERSGPGQPKCESCLPKRQAGIQLFFLSPVIAKRQNALCIHAVVQFHSCYKFWFPSVCFTIISIGNSILCSDIWHKYHEWYFTIVIQKSLSLSLKYHEWYLCQISRTNHATICLYHYPQKVCNFHI